MGDPSLLEMSADVTLLFAGAIQPCSFWPAFRGKIGCYFRRLKWARRFLTQQDSTDSTHTGFSLP
jgi:hypothetical protein